jgi:hypothetical protein
MVAEIKISDEDVAVVGFALCERASFPVCDNLCEDCADDGRAVLAALVASGWRREADVLREAANQLALLLTEAMRTGRENSGIDAYSGAAQVIDWLERRASAVATFGEG